MREEFLYYIWENRLTDKDLKTAEGETVEVVATATATLTRAPTSWKQKSKSATNSGQAM